MTVEEHLEYYARIKGIPIEFRQKAIDKAIEDYIEVQKQRDI